MKGIKTENSNHNFGPPNGHEDSVDDLPCEWVEDEEGNRVVRSVWKISDEERQMIANGANILLDLWWIGAFPPVAVGVTDEKEIETIHGLREGEDLGA